MNSSSFKFHNKCLYLLSKKFKDKVTIKQNSSSICPVYITVNSKLFIEYKSAHNKMNFIGIWHNDRLYNGKNMNSFKLFFKCIKNI